MAAVDWVIARTFTDSDGNAITRYWSGGKNWHDTIERANARFSSPTRARERYEASLRANGRTWQGEISVVEARPRNICAATGKMKHPSREHAERFLLRIWQDTRRRAQRNRREIRAYKCPGTPHWHLTSLESWEEAGPTRTSRVS